jgi:hypothetical protein
LDDGFFSAFGNLFSNYFGTASFFFLFVLLSALGIGYMVRSSRIEQPKMLIPSSVDAELLED